LGTLQIISAANKAKHYMIRIHTPSPHIITVTCTQQPTNITLALNTNQNINTTQLVNQGDNENGVRIARAIAHKFENRQIMVITGNESIEESVKDIIGLIKQQEKETAQTTDDKSESVGR
jgi:hypothetical protein